MSEQYKPYAASYVVLLQDNRVLLTRRANTGYMDGMYSLPAGHIEDKETARETAVREAKEEVGIDIDKDNLQCVKILHRNANADRIYIDFFFTCSVWKGEIENREPHKCDDISWWNIQDLPKDITPELAYVLGTIDEVEVYKEYNW